VFSVPLALAGSQRLLYRLFCRIQASSLWWLRLTGVLAVPGIQSAPLTRCPGPLNPLLSDTSTAASAAFFEALFGLPEHLGGLLVSALGRLP